VFLLALLVAAAPVRVYVAPLQAPGVDAATVTVVAERVLAATDRHRVAFDIVSSREVQTVMDAEAAQQALGCDAESCAAEIADALAAPQLVTGQLGRIGNTWQLTLTRTERATLRALARVHAQAEGDTPEALLPQIPELVDSLFGFGSIDAGASPLVALGAVGAGVGGVGLLAGGVMVAVAWERFFAAQAALDAGKVSDAEAARDLGQVLAIAGWGGVAVGAVIGVAGAVALAAGLMGGDE
jgi:hypothetical protein